MILKYKILRSFLCLCSCLSDDILAFGVHKDPQELIQDRWLSSRKLLYQNERLECPKSNGLFPYARDCSKYINCANNYPHLQTCGPGTLFNPQYNVCDWPQNTICYAKPNNTQTAKPDETKHRGIMFPTKPYIFDSLFPGSNHTAVITTRRTYLQQTTTMKSVLLDHRKKRAKISNTPSLCLKPKGQFPYPKDCSKFVNCWNNRETLQSCAPGTLFDASNLRCSWPHVAVCGGKEAVKGESENRINNKTDVSSGQAVRLRGSGSPSVGYLQIKVESNWFYVIHKGGDRKNTDNICNIMGFKRGTRSSTSGLVYGNQDLTKGAKVLKCSELDNIADCNVINFNQKKHTQHIVGLRCKEDSASVCPFGWHSWKSNCFYFNSSHLLPRRQSSKKCESMGGQLLTIEDQEKNNYLSDLLVANGINGAVHTSGILRHGKEWAFKWTGKTSSLKSKYDNWWPDIDSASFVSNYQMGRYNRKIYCVTLRNIYEKDDMEVDADYFFWNMESCYTSLNYVCQQKSYDIGCIHGNGEDYSGSANLSYTGMPCKFWTDIYHNIQSSLESYNVRENYCANPDGDQSPWCFVESGLAEACDIPRCAVTEYDKQESATVCKHNEKMCKSGECIHLDHICDGTKDCIGGEDEAYCTDYGPLFNSIHSHAMVEYETEVYILTPLHVCQRRCIESKDFNCLSLSHEEESQTCILSRVIAFQNGGLMKKQGWIYYFRHEYAFNCSNLFKCNDYKCISAEQVCNGKVDCRGSEDEKECFFNESFEIRLVNGAGPHEGNIEVKVGLTWGKICHDIWDIQDGNVVCRQLGFTKGAKIVHTNSRFGESSGEYVMDDVDCIGSEKTLTDCPFAGWMKHDCIVGEAAGVTCYQEHESCSEDHFECNNGNCIRLAYYCDTIDDCGDKTDEIRDICHSPTTLRLARGKRDLQKVATEEKSENFQIEGRVEVRYKGVWGTICDDDIALKEGHVLCRMLGWTQAESIHKNSKFGGGYGPIWVDELACLGSETDITDCSYKIVVGISACDHTEDLGVRCTNDTLDLQPFETLGNHGKSRKSDVLPDLCGITYINSKPSSASPKVVHGTMPSPGAHPWMAGIRKKTTTGSAHWCGAFIITNRILLTAAHCVVTYDRNRYFVRTGDFNNKVFDTFEERWELDEIILHPNYGKRVHFSNDIALVRIKPRNGKFLSFNKRVQPICLPPETWRYEAGTNCTVAGWGSSGSLGYSHVLLSAIIPIISDDKCKDDLLYGSEDITEAMFCAGYLEGGTDTCKGDSGGPLICKIEGVNTAVGIISWGHGCARANKPGVYTKLTHFLEWIYSNL